MSNTIILTGGGTAGHVIPCIAVAERLTGWRVHYIGRKSGIEKELAEKHGITYHGIDCPRFARNKPWTLLSVPFKLLAAKKQAKKLLKDIKPDVIFSKGGYVSLPVVLAAGSIPVVLHESDRSFGLANRMVLKKCRAVCTSFPVSYPGAVLTGSPLLETVYSGSAAEAKKLCGFAGGRPVLLIVGGSLGAKALNDAVDKDLPKLTARYDVVHITGKGNSRPPSPGYCPIEFTDKLHSIMKLADCAVTRGGGNTIFELAALGVPSVIVPLPKGASRGDQVENARYFEEQGYALTEQQSAVESHGLLPALERLAESGERIRSALKKGGFDGSGQIAKILRNAAK